MKLIWMIILKNSILLPFVLLALLGCNNNAIETKTNNTISTSLGNSDSVIIYFSNILDQNLLVDYQFGVCSKKEELPLDLIFERDSSCIITKQNSILRKQYLRDYNNLKDSMFGYFYKAGFQLRRFYIPNNVVRMWVKIEPNPSQIVIKAIDDDFSDRFDSILVQINRKEKLVYSNISKTNTSISEQFIFTKQQLSKDLIFINYNIYPNENLQIELMVFNKYRNYRNIYNIDYQPFTKTVLEVY